MISPVIERLFASAEHAAGSQKWDEARAGYLQVLELAPEHVDAMLQLSYLESIEDRHRAAHQWALRAAAAALPSTAEGLVDLIRRLRTFNEGLTLRGCVDRMLASASTPVDVLVEAASQLSNLNDFEAAFRCTQASLERTPEHLAARLAHGQMLAHFGRLSEAEAIIAGVLLSNPGIPTGWWMLARLRKQTSQSNHVEQIYNLLRRKGLAADDVAALTRALHKELDDLGDYEGAWWALELMCRARKSQFPYRHEETRRLVDALIARVPTSGTRTEPDGHAPVPIFIIGMHRSGTTLLEQLVSSGPDVKGLGEMADFTSAMRSITDHYCRDVLDATIVERASGTEMALVGKQYLDGIAWRHDGFRYFTDKRPSNFLNAGFICDALPQAKLLHMVRDSVQTCFSNLRELFTDINAFSYDQRDLAAYHHEYQRLMRHWHTIYPGRILDVDYSRLTSNPEAVMREVAAFCGIDYEGAMSTTTSNERPVSTASSVQVRQDVSRSNAPKWHPYREHLQPLIEALNKKQAQ